MAHETSSIDDLLSASKNANQPAAPESAHQDISVENEAEVEQAEIVEENKTDEVIPEEVEEEIERPDSPKEYDDYGNEKEASKTYTEDEVNERINRAVRERLERLERNVPPNQNNQAQPQQPQSEEWQQQLESFVEQTFHKLGEKQIQQARALKEQQAQAEFEVKFRNGMGRFNDFVEVVGAQPITDAMTLASRAMKDPAAFFYAASKRAPQELQRIANITDEYAQMVEIGRLEERMRKEKSAGTKAPRPLGKLQSDASITTKAPKAKEPSIEELIAKDEAKRRALQNQRRQKG